MPLEHGLAQGRDRKKRIRLIIPGVKAIRQLQLRQGCSAAVPTSVGLGVTVGSGSSVSRVAPGQQQAIRLALLGQDLPKSLADRLLRLGPCVRLKSGPPQ